MPHTFPFPECLHDQSDTEATLPVYVYELDTMHPEIAARIRLGDPLIGVVYEDTGNDTTWTLCELLAAEGRQTTLRALHPLSSPLPHIQDCRLDQVFTLWLIEKHPSQIWVDP